MFKLQIYKFDWCLLLVGWSVAMVLSGCSNASPIATGKRNSESKLDRGGESVAKDDDSHQAGVPVPSVHVDAVAQVPVTGGAISPRAAANAVATFQDPISSLLANIQSHAVSNKAAGIDVEIILVLEDRVLPVGSFHGEKTIQELGAEVQNGHMKLTFDGRKFAEGSFKEGRRDGLWTYWSYYGSKEFEVEYAGGMKHGHSIAWYNAEDGSKINEGDFHNGKQHGKWTYWGYPAYTLNGLPEPEITDELQRALRGLEQAKGVGKRIVILEEVWDHGRQTGP